jgi:hypothetical protein
MHLHLFQWQQVPAFADLSYFCIIFCISFIDDPECESWQGKEIFLFSEMHIPALGPGQHFIQWIPGFFPTRKVAGV